MDNLYGFDSLDKMVATWGCERCGQFIQWSYWDMVDKGCPICPKCDIEMYADLKSGKMTE